MTNGVAAKDCSDFGWIGIDQCSNRKTTVAESAIVSERRAQVSDTNNRHWPITGEPKFPTHLNQKVIYVVANTTSPKGAEIGKVFANFGGVHTSQFSKALG